MLENVAFWDVNLCHRASSFDVFEESQHLFLQFQRSTLSAGMVKLFEGACPNCLEILKKFFRVPMGILKRKIRFLSLPLSIALSLIRIVIYEV